MSAIRKIVHEAILSLGWTRVGPYADDITNFWVNDATVDGSKVSAVVAKLKFRESCIEVSYYLGLPDTEICEIKLAYSDPQLVQKLTALLEDSRRINPAHARPFRQLSKFKPPVMKHGKSNL